MGYWVDDLFNTLTGGPTQNDWVRMWPLIPIDTRSLVAGAPLADEIKARLVNEIPRGGSVYKPSGRYVDSVYESILLGATLATDADQTNWDKRQLHARSVFENARRASSLTILEQYHVVDSEPPEWYLHEDDASILKLITMNRPVGGVEMTLTCSYETVTVQRPWLDLTFLEATDWRLPGYAAEEISNAHGQGVMPYVVSTLLILNRVDLDNHKPYPEWVVEWPVTSENIFGVQTAPIPLCPSHS